MATTKWPKNLMSSTLVTAHGIGQLYHMYLLVIWHRYRFNTDIQKTSWYRVFLIADLFICTTLIIHTTIKSINHLFSCTVAYCCIASILALSCRFKLHAIQYNGLHIVGRFRNKKLWWLNPWPLNWGATVNCVISNHAIHVWLWQKYSLTFQ